MKIRFTLKRILALIGIVIILAFVYFMVRAGYSVSLDYLENPARLETRAPQPIETAAPKSGWLVLEDPEDTLSVELRDSVELALSSVGHSPTYAAEITEAQLAAATEGVIVTATELGNLGSLTTLLGYADGGGVLVFAVRPEVDDAFRSIYQQLGIYEHGFFADSTGIKLQAGLLTDEAYEVEGYWLNNSIIELHVNAQCSVYAVNDKGVPLIWSLPYGKGQMLVMNNSLMTYKATGGLMLSLLAQVKGPVIYPVINARSVALEAFPLPADVNSDFIREVYLRSGQAFLRDVWWNEMVRFSRGSGIPLTAGLMGGYDSEDSMLSTSVANEEMDLVFYAKELAKYDGELALTGFNQKPLYFSELAESMTFSPWSSAELAVQRGGEVMELFDGYFPSYSLYTYLPPERVMDEAGYELIQQIMPDLQVICGDFNDRQLWHQNFGVDENGIASFPVVTTGFKPDYLAEWNLLCVANALGVVFHSADVSDILLETDPANSWNIISEQFFDFADDILSETDYLDGMTVTAASWRLRDMLGMGADIKVESGRVRVSVPGGSMPEKAYFILHCPGRQPVEASGVKVTKISDGRYFITSTVPLFTLELVSE